MKFQPLSAAFLIAIVAALPATAAEPTPPKVTPVATGLDHPLGVAIQPGAGDVFVSESGAGRIIRLDSGGAVAVISGLPTAKTDSGKQATILGPWGLAFADRNLLAVGSSAQSGGKAPLRIYDLSPPTEKIAADKTKHSPVVTPAADKKATAAGNIVGLVNDGAGHLIVASSDPGHAERAWLGLVNANEEQVKAITPQVGTGGEQPGAITLSPRGEWVTAEGPASKSGHSLLKFYHPHSKKELLRLDIGLSDVSGLGYSPRTGWLYATAPVQGPKADGGVFRIDRTMVDGKLGVKAVLVAKLDRPSAMTFAPNGALYVTLLGKADSTAKEKPGSVVRLTGRL